MGILISLSYDNGGGQGGIHTKALGTEFFGVQCYDGDLCQQLCSRGSERVRPGPEQRLLVPALPKAVTNSKQFCLISQIK